ncbi:MULTISPECIES: type II secretion system protein [Tissierellales]|jgi:hypothetical protein|uniref:Type II secretion system protein n=1 Tax=Acidilutibacter cellobiosedens TaxID=2507161 RepID=A0A410QCR8_9FIRM|nr:MULTISPECIES: type II secretion system protein [Tissierellales]QAT61780.1 type II secretion system protein [Acidilutibacter cellobiosedens]SCL82281.1 hypothetical protein PP176A_0224 [Sporanaerobacter sp. PP17-6a]
MKRKGFFLIEILLGLFILGIVAVFVLPILNNALYNFSLLEHKMKMKYYGETVIENIKSYDYKLGSDFFILDESLDNIMDKFKPEGNAEIFLPSGSEKNKYPFTIRIYKEEGVLWKIRVLISHNGRKVKDVEYKSYIIKKRE